MGVICSRYLHYMGSSLNCQIRMKFGPAQLAVATHSRVSLQLVLLGPVHTLGADKLITLFWNILFYVLWLLVVQIIYFAEWLYLQQMIHQYIFIIQWFDKYLSTIRVCMSVASKYKKYFIKLTPFANPARCCESISLLTGPN